MEKTKESFTSSDPENDIMALYQQMKNALSVAEISGSLREQAECMKRYLELKRMMRNAAAQK